MLKSNWLRGGDVATLDPTNMQTCRPTMSPHRAQRKRLRFMAAQQGIWPKATRRERATAGAEWQVSSGGRRHTLMMSLPSKPPCGNRTRDPAIAKTPTPLFRENRGKVTFFGKNTQKESRFPRGGAFSQQPLRLAHKLVGLNVT